MSRIFYYLNIYEEIRIKAEADPEYFKNKQKQVPIYVDYSFGKRLRISTKIFVNPNDWDQSKQRVKATDPDSGPKNYRLTTIRGKLINIETEAIRDDIKMTVPYVKLKLSPAIIIKGDASSQKFFTDTWNEFVKLPDKNQGTRYNYENTLLVLQDFCIKKDRKLTLDEITMDFYQELISYFFIDRKIVRNTAGKYIKNLKAFMNYCTGKGFNINLDFKKFEVFKDQQLITYLTIDELKKLKNLELETETQKAARDLFLFMCFSGCRYSDTQQITPGHIKNDFIQFTTIKTKRPQSTPITPQALEILKKYNYYLPKLIIQTFNDTLKEIGGKAGFTQEITKTRFIGSDRIENKRPMNEFFSSHLAKRTFIKMYFIHGGSIDTIMKTTGNTDRKTMKHYLEIENQDIKNESDRIFGNLDI
jgi:integrase